jgi:hypothetical protein
MINSAHNQQYTDAPPASIALLVRSGQTRTLHSHATPSQALKLKLIALDWETILVLVLGI